MTLNFTFDGIGSDIDDNSALLDPVSLDKFSAADSNNKDISSLDNLGEVDGSGVAQGDSAVVLGQQAKHGSAL
jgi:hypothetical protein